MVNDVFELVEEKIDETVAVEKEQRLKAILANYPTIAVAYSGGVDSAYLCAVAYEVLGEKCTMVIADSPSLPRSEFKEATGLAENLGWNLVVIHTDEFENEEYLKNNGTRCYFCRSALFRKMKEYSDAHGVQVLAYGAMADDAFDPTRLGTLAANEYDIVAPLQEAELGKLEIRYLSHSRELPTYGKAAFACLSSRFPKGTPVTIEALEKVEAAEECLKTKGFYQYRARHHDNICRIELDPRDMERMLDPKLRAEIVDTIKAAGYEHVVLDLLGYQDPNDIAKHG